MDVLNLWCEVDTTAPHCALHAEDALATSHRATKPPWYNLLPPLSNEASLAPGETSYEVGARALLGQNGTCCAPHCGPFMKNQRQMHALNYSIYVLHSCGWFSQLLEISSFTLSSISLDNPAKTAWQTDNVAPSSEEDTTPPPRLCTYSNHLLKAVYKKSPTI